MKRKYAYFCYTEDLDIVIIASSRGKAKEYCLQYIGTNKVKIKNLGRVHHTTKEGGSSNGELYKLGHKMKRKNK